MTIKMLLKQIKIKNRFRKDFGDLEPLKESIKDIGLLHPPVINEDNILIAGERRLRAVEELGWEDVPVNQINLKEVIKGEYDENAVRKDFTKSEAVAIWLAMESYENKSVSISDTKGLKRRERAAKFLGMSTDTLSKAKQIVDTQDAKLIEELDSKGNVSVVYKRLKKDILKKELKETVEDMLLEGVVKGDALQELIQLDKESVGLCIIDPPYNIGFKSVRGGDTNDFNDEMPLDTFKSVLKEIYRVLKPNSHFYCFIGFQNYGDYKKLIEEVFDFKNCLIWVKNNHTPTNYDYNYAHKYEMIIFATKGKKPLNNKFSVDILEFDNIMGKIHNSEKPVDLLKYLIKNSSYEKEIVLDCFAGSGSTLVAAQELNRNFIGIEKELDFVNIIKKRLKDGN